jgi:hypothetical protein
MALHCAATLLLVPAGTSVDDVGDAGAWVAEPVPAGTDVVDGLQSLADQHRGERVLVPMRPEQVAGVLAHLGRVAGPGGATDRLRLEVGDDGWALVPWV